MCVNYCTFFQSQLSKKLLDCTFCHSVVNHVAWILLWFFVANFWHVLILYFLHQLQEKEARRFFQQIISGVDYCHRHMVVHRYKINIMIKLFLLHFSLCARLHFILQDNMSLAQSWKVAISIKTEQASWWLNHGSTKQARQGKL